MDALVSGWSVVRTGPSRPFHPLYKVLVLAVLLGPRPKAALSYVALSRRCGPGIREKKKFLLQKYVNIGFPLCIFGIMTKHRLGKMREGLK